jgi:hypothetical protein
MGLANISAIFCPGGRNVERCCGPFALQARYETAPLFCEISTITRSTMIIAIVAYHRSYKEMHSSPLPNPVRNQGFLRFNLEEWISSGSR